MLRSLIFWLFVVKVIFGQEQECGISDNHQVPDNDRIVNGEDAPIGAWPWIAELTESTEHVHQCGGNILNNRWILTAAHCFDWVGVEPESWILSLAEHELHIDSLEENNQTIRPAIDKIIVHQQYNATTAANDLAMIKLVEPLEFNARIRPICLPEADQEFNELSPSCYAAGWGYVNGSTREEPTILQQVHSQIVENELCDQQHIEREIETYGQVYEEGAIILENNICFGDGSKSTCIGDSGGPMMCSQNRIWTLVGVTSWGPEVCQNSPAIFTKVIPYLDWIRNIIDNE